MAQPAEGRRGAAAPLAYAERLWVPWWTWLVTLAVAGLLAAQLHAGRGGLWAWLPYVVVGALTVGGLARLGSGQVRVDPTGVRGGRLALRLDQIASVEELDADHTRRATGRDGDPRGLVFQRPWVHTSVKVVGRDDDPPYLLLSTRRPAAFAAAIVRCAAERVQRLPGDPSTPED